VALERSDKFVAAMRESFRRRGLNNARIYELDLMTGDLPKGNYDFSWCAGSCRLSADQAVVDQETRVMAIRRYLESFHEYCSLWNWRFSSTHPESGKISRARDRNLGGSRAENRMALPNFPVLLSHKWVYYSVATPHIF